MSDKVRILILDDDEVFVAMVAAALAEEYDVATGKNGREGLILCRRVPAPHVVITDIGMPDMDGISLLKALQKEPQTSSIPVVILTATHFNRTSRAEVQKYAQVRSILHKPCSIDQLSDTVRKILEKYSR